jgi:hypothetical protein
LRDGQLILLDPGQYRRRLVVRRVLDGALCRAAVAGGPTPAIDALIETVRHMSGRNFAAEARTLDRGLAGMDAPQIRRIMADGFA